MAKRKPKTIDWDALRAEASDLRNQPISPEERLEKARTLAATFREHGQPLPHDLAILV